ncbi:MAG: hypothetical protein Q8918_11400 [Bacteroidota bacterium]|nr:hypothetical protein [Bacteroidota bacterium]MDP4213153.1 hypothetical protein [Bacteroidota bacterium]MDP4250703.1 hypothetical protein [Bacteroidota bacterium]
MTEERNDMFSGESGIPDDNKLMKYLNGSLPDAERDHLEDQVQQNPFLQDAVEGLNTVGDKADLPKVVQHLNKQLSHLLPKKTRKHDRDAKFGEWIYWTILVVLLLAITGFLMLRFMLKP